MTFFTHYIHCLQQHHNYYQRIYHQQSQISDLVIRHTQPLIGNLLTLKIASMSLMRQGNKLSQEKDVL